MRSFRHKEWEYSLALFNKLSKAKPFIRRFRLEYAFLLMNHKTGSSKLRAFLHNGLGCMSLAYNLIRYQLFQPFHFRKVPLNIFYLSDNHAYLQNLVSVIQDAVTAGHPVLILCPANHHVALADKLPQKLREKLVIIQRLVYKRSFVSRIISFLYACLLALADGLWFSFQKADHASAFSSALSRYSLSERYFGKMFRQMLDKDTRLIAANDHWFWESLLFTAARERQLHSMVIQHGIIGDISYPLFAEKFLAWGEIDREVMLQDNEAAPDEVQVVGSPYFDSVYERARQKMKGRSAFDSPFITFLTQPFLNSSVLEPGYYEKIMQRFYALQGLADEKAKQLIIKLHPQDKEQFYKARPDGIEILNYPLLDILERSCLVITVDSTSMLEAAMFGMPAVQSSIEGMKRDFDYSHTGVCIHVRSDEALMREVTMLLNDRSYYDQRITEAAKGLAKFYYGLGSSLQRIEKLLI